MPFIVLSSAGMLRHFRSVIETITLREVLEHYDAGAPFSFAFVTCDQNRKTGGEWIEIKEAVKHNYLSRQERAKLAQAQPKPSLSKNPNHYANSTLNVRLENGQIRKVHVRLIRKFNCKTVL